ncbi:MAG: sulfatase-like hydrolase/transferase [bacterium]|nr:sulfatase-like hydrolase/transferase [bacterium]
MKRVGWILGLLLPLAVAVGGVLWLRSAPQPPNVLLITVDTLRADRLGLYGNERASSPAIDAFAESAVVFDGAFTQASLSAPSHATMFTGLYPPAHGVISNGVPLDDGLLTVAEVFASSGYETAMFVSHPLVGDEFGLGQGFDEITLRTVFSHGADHRHEDFVWAERRGRPSAIFDETIEWLAEPREGPFFAWLHVQHPHGSYEPPPPFDTAFSSPPDSAHDLRCTDTLDAHLEEEIDLSEDEMRYFVDQYDGEVQYVDTQLARVFSALQERGIDERTVVVLTADHGEALFDDEARRRTGHGGYRVDPVLRVPLIVRDPRRAGRSGRVEEMVGLIDLAPTMLELAGVEPPAAFVGESLLPLLDGGSEAPRDVNYSCTFHRRAVRMSARTERWKLICNKKQDDWRCGLFDLERDPREWNDLSRDAAHADELNDLRAGLEEWFHGQMDGSVLHGALPDNERVRELLRRAGYLRPERPGPE